MPPSTPTEGSKPKDDGAASVLREAIKCFNGTIDFDRLAAKMGVANAEAMRKRFRRLFEKDEEPLNLKGSTLGTTEFDVTPPAKSSPRTPRTPKHPNPPSTTADEGSSDTPKTAASKKRKAGTTPKSAKKQKTEAVMEEETGQSVESEEGKETAEDANAEVKAED